MYASVTCVNIGSGNGLSPERHQAITWINDDLSSIELLGTNFTEICEYNYDNFLSRNCIQRFIFQHGRHFAEPIETTSNKILLKIQLFCRENAFGNVLHNMAVILFHFLVLI